MAPAHLGVEMPDSRCALTATKPGTGERRPAFIHPCARPHFATNLRTRATLHHYHLDGDEVNADSRRIRDDRRAAVEFIPILQLRLREAGFLLRAQRRDRRAHQLLDTGLTIRILDWQGARGAIAG